jgi:septum formation protein
MESLRWVLASGSPRRQALMRVFGVPFEVHPAQIEEHLPEHAARPAVLGKRLARAKAEAVALHYPDALIIAADTLVVIDGRVLGQARRRARGVRDAPPAVGAHAHGNHRAVPAAAS